MQLNKDICEIISNYIYKSSVKYELLDWIDIDKLNWDLLSSNPNAIQLLSKNKEKIKWYLLSSNPNAINLLKNNPDKIDWHLLSQNPNDIDLLKNNPDKIDWDYISLNPSIFKEIKEDNLELVKRTLEIILM